MHVSLSSGFRQLILIQPSIRSWRWTSSNFRYLIVLRCCDRRGYKRPSSIAPGPLNLFWCDVKWVTDGRCSVALVPLSTKELFVIDRSHSSTRHDQVSSMETNCGSYGCVIETMTCADILVGKTVACAPRLKPGN